jgi:hypothetical protein
MTPLIHLKNTISGILLGHSGICGNNTGVQTLTQTLTVSLTLTQTLILSLTPTNLPSYCPTNLPTIQLPTYWSADLPTCRRTHLQTYSPNSLPTYWLTDLQTTNDIDGGGVGGELEIKIRFDVPTVLPPPGTRPLTPKAIRLDSSYSLFCNSNYFFKYTNWYTIV